MLVPGLKSRKRCSSLYFKLLYILFSTVVFIFDSKKQLESSIPAEFVIVGNGLLYFLCAWSFIMMLAHFLLIFVFDNFTVLHKLSFSTVTLIFDIQNQL